MKKVEADALVDHVNLNEPVRMILGYRSTGSNISLNRVAIASDAQNMFTEIAANVLKNRNSRSPEDWEPARPISPETYLVTEHTAVGDLPQVASSDIQPLLKALINTDHIREVDGNALRKTDPYFYAFQVGTGDTSLTFLRKLNPLRGLRKRRIAMLDDELCLVDHPVFAFDSNADMIVTPTHLIIFSQTAFAAIFRGQAELDRMTRQWVEDICRSTPMTDSSYSVLLAKGKSDSRIGKRIESISRRGHLAPLKPADLRKGMERCDLDPERYLNDSGELVFDEKSVAEVLKFLNEDMFKGALTDTSFEVDSKMRRY